LSFKLWTAVNTTQSFKAVIICFLPAGTQCLPSWVFCCFGVFCLDISIFSLFTTDFKKAVAEFGVKNQSGCSVHKAEQMEVLQAVAPYTTLRKKTDPGLQKTPLGSHRPASLRYFYTLA